MLASDSDIVFNHFFPDEIELDNNAEEIEIA